MDWDTVVVRVWKVVNGGKDKIVVVEGGRGNVNVGGGRLKRRGGEGGGKKKRRRKKKGWWWMGGEKMGERRGEGSLNWR